MGQQRRMISSSLFRDSNFRKISPEAGLLFIGLIVNADDEGRGSADTACLSTDIFLGRGYQEESVLSLLEEVKTSFGNLVFYFHKNDLFYAFLKWHDYQTLRKDRIKKSSIPPPTNNNIIPDHESIREALKRLTANDQKKHNKAPEEKTDNSLLKKKKKLREQISVNG